MKKAIFTSIQSELKNIGLDFKDKFFQLFLVVTLVLLLIEYFGWQSPFYKMAAPLLGVRGTHHEMTLYAQIYTTISFLILFVILPTVFYLVTGKKKEIQGLSLPRLRDASPYLIFGLFMIVVLAIACKSPNFYQFYPLYRPKSFQDWLIFEAIYLPQFIAVEFFFRGPLLFSFHSLINRRAILLMTLPYALIHIHKPFPEAIGSIGAGLILGHYSLKSNSIWFRVLLHMLIAIGADFFGLLYSGTLGSW